MAINKTVLNWSITWLRISVRSHYQIKTLISPI